MQRSCKMAEPRQINLNEEYVRRSLCGVVGAEGSRGEIGIPKGKAPFGARGPGGFAKTFLAHAARSRIKILKNQ